MTATIRVARKAHACSSCGRRIEPGQRYQDRRSRRFFGEAIRECLTCVRREADGYDDWHEEALDAASSCHGQD